jgi:hypothetical protein
MQARGASSAKAAALTISPAGWDSGSSRSPGPGEAGKEGWMEFGER